MNIARIEKAYHILSGAKLNQQAAELMEFAGQFIWPVEDEPAYMLLARRKALRAVLTEAIEFIRPEDFRDHNLIRNTSDLHSEALILLFVD